MSHYTTSQMSLLFPCVQLISWVARGCLVSPTILAPMP